MNAHRLSLVFYIFCALSSLTSCVPPAGSGTASVAGSNVFSTPITAKNEDFIYNSSVKTAMLYYTKGTNFKQDALNFPVIKLGDFNGYLRLEFDELSASNRNYYIKIIPCNSDWTTANLQEMEYLPSFNEFIAESFEVSINTRKPYYHYTFHLPAVKLSGNYIVKAYRDRNVDDFVLTKRFVVYEDVTSFSPDVKFPLDISRRFNGQQIDFTLGYYPIADQVFNPAEMLKVVFRQNGRWDKAVYGLKPQFIRDEINTLDFHFFNTENVIDGGNEWRNLDLRSMRFLGQGMATTNFDNQKAEIGLLVDQSRNQRTYNQWVDANGQYFIENFETKGGPVESDYVYTTFKLFSPTAINGDVYVYGKMTDWQLDPDFKMHYDSASTSYQVRVLLKQGFYNYQYVLKQNNKPTDFVFFEGSYNQTENVYDFFAYFRPIGSRYDKCVGYAKVGYFGRQ
jgi:Domain of unknown function (DUF5103)